jgi:hypothetical protein
MESEHQIPWRSRCMGPLSQVTTHVCVYSTGTSTKMLTLLQNAEPDRGPLHLDKISFFLFEHRLLFATSGYRTPCRTSCFMLHRLFTCLAVCLLNMGPNNYVFCS